MAASISFAHCEHGSIYLRLHDKDGVIFAAGSMDAVTAVDAMTDLGDEIEAVVDLIQADRLTPAPEVH